MALKRSSKGFGKAVNRPMASAVRHLEVRTRQQMAAGQSYEGWLCKSGGCGLVIAVAPAPAGTKLAEPDDHLVAAKCPHCGNEDLYRWNSRGEHPFLPKDTPGAVK